MSSLIINFKYVFSFLVWNIYFTFLLSVVYCTFCKSNIKSNCILLLCDIRVRSSRQEVFCKRDVLWNLAIFTRKHLPYSLSFKNEALAQVFSCKFCKVSNNTFFLQNTVGGFFLCFRVNLHSTALQLPDGNMCNIWSLGEQ